MKRTPRRRLLRRKRRLLRPLRRKRRLLRPLRRKRWWMKSRRKITNSLFVVAYSLLHGLAIAS